jgi:competence transcription factor ComK
MVANSNFISNDYDLAFTLQKLFHEYVAVYTKLNFSDSQNSVSNAERRELNAKVQDYLNEINLLVMKMKRFQADTEIIKSHNHQTMSASKRSQRVAFSQ